MQTPSPPFTQQRPRSARKGPSALGAGDFLRADDKMAALLPTLTRVISLQKDCAKILPSMFDACDVLQLDSGQLTLATPNAALATKLKQQLPKLQEELGKLGWQVNVIRLKVQVGKMPAKSIPSRELALPALAVTAFAELGQALEASPRNEALRAALMAMVARRRV
ncbi:MAG: DciA family protein [Pseudomonadota bacterium]